MHYVLDFADLRQYLMLFARGAALTIALTAVSTVVGVFVGALCAVAREDGPAWLKAIAGLYVELIRNTPFIVQLCFIFFGLPSLGIHIDEMSAAIVAMSVNLGAYATEIIRAGMRAVPRGLSEAGQSLAMSRAQILRHVILPQAFAKVFPALASQIVIVMLGSAVVSQISVPDLSYAANFVQSRTFRAFESYLIVTALYLLLAIALRRVLMRGARRLFRGMVKAGAR
ncbi:amino acid ABC transporter permease [Pandoraea nosoerga]|uniref:ABC transporter permease n=1 Tax=Pandoraea nosoerga TaxID=2508296 RepID=A0A5E4S548_9BURK|nr:amino acid ABC transporter permease [Pandoraea nosoerga]MBN4667268.1 amino acid ABC transporter permease [Pandoraea nosoerga]MBN4676603.1 amino acid ABC transporter permease [Pandoraea nosoerga]MBN4682165.1 amino acid ABC transporter permease [Pandoraea nosoerga]MBN4743466.1 amino acid ABC transporter permease [Pandoraea nosoerga]VVD69704.1 ABC transporter permease [Pandoraea nosoerga]